MLQQHVDHKITNALLKKGTRDAYKTWNQQDHAWVDMRLHELHDEGGFGVKKNTITRRAATYTTNARIIAFLGTFACPAQQVWLPGNNLQDPATWMGPLSDMQYTDQPAAAQPAPPSAQAAALLPTRAQTRSISAQAPRTTATANSFFRSSSTASTRHSSGVRFPTRRLPALRTSSPLVGQAPFRRNAASRSSSPSTGPNSRPCVSTTLARGSRSSASSTCLKSTRPRSRNQASAWR
jgi:hypothetical protein